MRKRRGFIERLLWNMQPWTVDAYTQWCEEQGYEATPIPDAMDPTVSKRSWEKRAQTWRRNIQAWQQQARVEDTGGSQREPI